ncbi:MAG: Na(+)/H(+) antiporter subunit D [Oceanicaulis sp.]
MTDLFGFLEGVSPAWPLILGGLLALAIPSAPFRKLVMIAAPLLAIAAWFATREPGVYGLIDLGPMTLETYRYDALSRVWALVFVLIAFINGVYAFHERGRFSDAASLIYAGSAVGAVFAGDLLTLFFFWELTAIASVPLILAAGGPKARRAGLRYLAIQVLSGVLVLGGGTMWAVETGSWAFDRLNLGSAAGWALLIGFGIKACFPVLHMWMTDAYPKATAFGAVVLSAFTTKMAIYALARGFPGLDLLIYVGAAMAVYPIVFAIVENDLRRTLAYGLMNQLGFMVVAVGVGSELALNGAAANAFAGVIYMALMFMVTGAILKRTGTAKATELGGLFSAMPLTGMFAIVGALAVVGAPLFSGFVAKTLILSAVHYDHIGWLYALLIFASAGVAEQSALKVPYFAFFGRKRAWTVSEAPTGMLAGMGLCAFLCVYLGVNYEALYGLLPFDFDYEPYKIDSVIGQIQILLSGLVAFGLLVWFRLYPLRDRTLLDLDWIYRYFGDGATRWGVAMSRLLVQFSQSRAGAFAGAARAKLFAVFSPAGTLSREFPAGLMALWTAILLAGVVLVAYFSPL